MVPSVLWASQRAGLGAAGLRTHSSALCPLPRPVPCPDVLQGDGGQDTGVSHPQEEGLVRRPWASQPEIPSIYNTSPAVAIAAQPGAGWEIKSCKRIYSSQTSR